MKETEGSSDFKEIRADQLRLPAAQLQGIAPPVPPPGAPNSLVSAAARTLDAGAAAMAPCAGHSGTRGPLLRGLLLLAAALSRPAAPCPFQCYCFAGPKLLLRCASGAELRQPPRDVPPDARNLTIVGANLTVLRAAAFAGGDADGEEEAGVRLPLLTALRLTQNNIEVVEDGAFDGLPSLTALDLSQNPLRVLGGAAFRGLLALRSLQLNQALAQGGPALLESLDAALTPLAELRFLSLVGNALSHLPPAALRLPRLEKLDARRNALPGLDTDELRALERDGDLLGPRLLLADNPLRCGCTARPLLAWLRNATERVPDARRLRCAAPRPLHNRSFLELDEAWLRCADDRGDGRGEEVELAGPELEASYVFFGLVLALIGLIFLMVLYLNRRGIQRWMRNLREACRDQMEGYHYRYEQDADPRRAATPAAPAGSRATSPGSGL
ncbi:PREDICTED: trophoblast glycoprotein-like [Elephantulus edwardii]|uniref:trophoblast glycoprotein-like n=1 Tax=Elephantulus edwardii TaxID=28737 RepID=UPI0003F0DCA1|nr:PREDICTED: trophoblast glycoprotein-like [Elephantulus edwardii]